jgi:hypothetical protein
MNLRVKGQSLRIRLDLAELRTLLDEGKAELGIQFGLTKIDQLRLMLATDEKFSITCQNKGEGLILALVLPREDLNSLFSDAAPPVAKKKLVRHFAGPEIEGAGRLNVEFELDAFSLRDTSITRVTN